ncbi:MAG: nicotinate-nicotinamide nucleotide adenylyltransferase [Actinobacteria bacterium]|nr:nicotinate-nicotinamide nucleotide adenylyltransferase [Actinomycetota bacterium]
MTATAADPHPERIGVLGGTFDPPHGGHAAAAEAAVEVLGLDLLYLVVANDPWQKTADSAITPVGDRLAMTRALAGGLSSGTGRLVVDDREIRRGGPSYMADTLAELGEEHPGAELLLLLGTDAARLLDTWVRPDEVRERATIVVMRRPGQSGGPPPGWAFVELEADLPEVSSSELRSRYATGAGTDHLLPAGVDDVIRKRSLYGVGGAA